MTNTITTTGEEGGTPSRPSWSRMGREPPVEPVRPMRPAPGTTGTALSRVSENARRSMSMESNEPESLDPSLEALRMIRDSLNYNSTGDHHTFFVMGASVGEID